MSMRQKIDRVRHGAAPRVLDLFAGCGGISLGFHSAGFNVVGAVEFDPAAAMTHALNFHGDASSELFEIHSKARDITKTEPADLIREYGLKGRVDSQVDVIVGGPPCQAFARVGRAKLREVAEHPEAFLQDSRSNLYLRYLEYVRVLKPIALLIENVPDVLNFGGHNIAEEICEALQALNYDVRYTMLNSVFYGVPEMRERMFLVAFRKEYRPQQWFPEPTHWIDLPRGYHGSRQVALKTIKTDMLEEQRFFVDPPESHPDNSAAFVTAIEALSDLPVIGDDSPQKKTKGPRRFTNEVPYSKSKQLCIYQKLMRTWPGFEANTGISDHVIRYLPRDYKIFARMNPGDQYPEAHKLALQMFEERLNEIEHDEGIKLKKNSSRYKAEYDKYVPPYDPKKIPK